MFIKLEPGGLITPWTGPRVRGVDGVRSATAAGVDDELRSSSPLRVVGRYKRVASRDDDPEHAKAARTVGQIMEREVTTLPLHARIDEAWRVMTEHRFRHIPVVDPALTDAIVGMLSDRDLLAAAAHVGAGSSRAVSEIMTTTVVACRRATPIRTAAEAMLSERIGALPVVTPDGHLVGIVSRSDILRAVVHEAPIELWV